MSKYTTEVRYICEVAAGLKESEGLDSVDQIIKTAAPKIFDFDYPIFAEEHRATLQEKILLNYYTREIGFETVGLWKLKLMSKMRNIMPYYNKLYESTLMEFDPLTDTKIVKDHSGTHMGTTEDKGTDNLSTTSHGSTTASNTRKDLYSDTPQGALTNVENETYLTNARITSDSGNNTADSTYTEARDTGSTTTSNRNETFKETVSGKVGTSSYADLLMKYRDSIINVDQQVIDELADLFFGLW